MHFESMTTANGNHVKQAAIKLSAQAKEDGIFSSGRSSSLDLPRSLSYVAGISALSGEQMRDEEADQTRRMAKPQAHQPKIPGGTLRLPGSVQTSQPNSLVQAPQNITIPQFSVARPPPASAPTSPGSNRARRIQSTTADRSNLYKPPSHAISEPIEAGAQSGLLYKASNMSSTKKVNTPPPLPINRATKPKMHLTSQAPIHRTQALSHESPRQSVPSTEQPSPFSTPSSSDGSPGLEGANAKNLKLNSKSSDTPVMARDYFHSFCYAKTALDAKVVKEAPVLPARRPGFNVTEETVAASPGSSQERPPGLPPRPGLDGGPHTFIEGSERFVRSPRINNTARPKSRIFSIESTTPPKRIQAPSGLQISKQTTSFGGQEISPATSEINKLYLFSTVADRHTDNGRDTASSNAQPMAGIISSSEYPDSSQGNRRPPYLGVGIQEIETKYDTRLFDVSARYVCTSGYLTKIWHIDSGELMLNLSHGEREIKVTSMAFKPALDLGEEGSQLWLGTNYGEIQELDILRQVITDARPNAHPRREVCKIYRYRHEMWSLDEDGKLQIWLPDSRGLPNLQTPPKSCRVAKGHTFSIVVRGLLWLATGKEIRIFDPSTNGETSFQVLQQPLVQPGVGEVTSGAVLSNQTDRVYFGHADGKVTIYLTTDYTCLGVVNVSVYKINSLAGAGFYLWAGYNTGMIYVYDTRMQPWKVKKDWQAHGSPVAAIMTNKGSAEVLGALTVASIGNDNMIRIWDGTLEMDWMGK